MYCRFSADRVLPAKSPALPALNKSVTNLQAWLLSMQKFPAEDELLFQSAGFQAGRGAVRRARQGASRWR